jgi:hypothetical protein
MSNDANICSLVKILLAIQAAIPAPFGGARAAKREQRVCPRGRCSTQANRRTTFSATAIMTCWRRVFVSPT